DEAAAEHVDECTLAGAVLSEKSMDPPGVQGQGDVVERNDTGEGPDDVRQLDHRTHAAVRRCCALGIRREDGRRLAGEGSDRNHRSAAERLLKWTATHALLSQD